MAKSGSAVFATRDFKEIEAVADHFISSKITDNELVPSKKL